MRRRDPEVRIFGRIRVGSGTFIGLDCIILPGITIGENCIIGAASVVTRDIPDGSLACGNPARIIGTASVKLVELEASPNLLRTYHLSEEELERAIKKHFGLIYLLKLKRQYSKMILNNSEPFSDKRSKPDSRNFAGSAWA
ncbi:MAG TPA: DapH/DapD/GlmU-related protein [Bryobacteraceae bacterium]|nr:DapH/DapD/GlmU-related protein [Bryobacteraceae bacterium]